VAHYTHWCGSDLVNEMLIILIRQRDVVIVLAAQKEGCGLATLSHDLISLELAYFSAYVDMVVVSGGER